jgi:hypothetical protein
MLSVKLMLCIVGQDVRSARKGEERLNSALLDVLHSANQHGNVIRGYIVSIERLCPSAEACGGMSVAASPTSWWHLPRGRSNITPSKDRQPRRTVSAAHGENDLKALLPHILPNMDALCNVLACGW